MSKFFNIYLKLITILLCHQVLTVNAAKTRIVGGKPTTINTQKYIVSLRKTDGKFHCGGSLVNKNYVVTAAHCVEPFKASDFKVHGGVTYLNQVGEQRSVEKIILPQAYNTINYTMDVAVLKLSSPMEGPNVATIGICGHELHLGDSVIISGWGVTVENTKTPSNQLLTTTLRMISPTECKAKNQYVSTITDTMMCAASAARDTCTGDSGGPLVHNGQLCGIVSFGHGCARPEYPGVYTDVNVNKVKEFINKSAELKK